jgi:hypothetical protein
MVASVDVNSTASTPANSSAGGNFIGGPTIIFPSGSDSSTPLSAFASGSRNGFINQILVGVLVALGVGLVLKHLRKG